ncbi:serine/threonine protein kinase [Actinomadura pelletieri DSM 43383]|uniref:Serine/threonine protein kinase n=1 Tax=Actinomadura pelletieri DSM 43383 TaxID=1120940 RepID=A0A495QIW1_9ACTN|nr:serine/threonine-protein kinase [Actinomadura pelletieri]RKS71934.1 serine/threonine protein kinase [Actinomadura pelletieri DSM 43383]
MIPREHRLPGFVELAKLGTGAQGEVVLARHESSGTPVAIKYLTAGLLGDSTARDTFRQEVQILGRVVDPHVARLLDYRESPWGAAIILEAVRGRPLRKVLDELGGPLTPEAALAILKGSLLGLAAAHAVGVVHRDYKPANVLVQDDGQSKLIDFGIAVLVGQGGQAGTPAYMSPEQWEGEPATPATDLYAATCVFVEAVSGEKPFRGTTVEELRTAHTVGPIPLNRVPDPLRPLVLRGLARRPSERVNSAHQFVSELEAIAVRAYGAEWERRGMIALGTVAASVGLAVLASAFPTSVATSAATGVANTVAPVSKGFLAKIGGAKAAAGIGAMGVGTVLAVWLFWPGPGVGGTSRAGVHAYFKKPGVLLQQAHMPASETPYIKLEYTLTPARAKPGTEVRLVERFRARTPEGVYYPPGGGRQCFGVGTPSPKTHFYKWGIGLDDGLKSPAALGFYRMPPVKRNDIPQKTTNAIVLPADEETTGEHQPFVQSECATMSSWTSTLRIVLPEHDLLPPGKYLVTPRVPMKITSTLQGETPIPPEAAGAPLTEGCP